MTIAQTPFEDEAVEAAFAAFPEGARPGLLAIREMIFQVAAEVPQVGPVEEALKWGQPAYLTPTTKSGSTIRLGVPKSGGYAVFTHCQTTIMSDFQALFPDDFSYEGNRAVMFPDGAPPPLDRLRLLVTAALTYHRR